VRRIVASSKEPGSCGSAFVAQSFSFHLTIIENNNRKKSKSTLSVDAYKRLIASKIAARAGGKNPHRAGEVIAAFRVNEYGQIDQITIKKSSSPSLSEHVKNILSGVKAPPPPEGPILLGQPFNFR